MIVSIEPAGLVTERAFVSSARGRFAREMTGEGVKSAEPGATEASKWLVCAAIESSVLIKAATCRELSFARGAGVCAGPAVAVSSCAVNNIALGSSRGGR